ncbi:C3HC zinc finger-like protein [Wolffia australiana]
MAEETEKKFKRIMDKLYHSPPSPSFGKEMGTPLKRRRWELGVELEKNRSVRRARGEEGPSPCRPWDRGDLIRRLATFKAMTWFGKPKAIDPVNCARRGWINVEMDTLACEACGARLLFSNPSSWTLQQVEKAAAVFSLKLDSGHKLLCPWTDNICEEALAFFPPTPAPTLIQGFKERSAAWLRVSALPVISSMAIDFMNSPQLEIFLTKQAVSTFNLDGGMKLTENIGSLIFGVDDAGDSILYIQAHKILSLCGWEPRPVPYVVKYTADSSPKIAGVMSISGISGRRDDEICDNPASEEKYDPSSVVLECKLCGSCVGLWAFATVSQPLELFNLIESPEDPTQEQEPSNQSLTLTIAGGPPPTKQNLKPTVSLPIVARNLRAVFESSAVERSHAQNQQIGDQPNQNPSNNQEGETILSDDHQSNGDATCPDVTINIDDSSSCLVSEEGLKASGACEDAVENQERGPILSDDHQLNGDATSHNMSVNTDDTSTRLIDEGGSEGIGASTSEEAAGSKRSLMSNKSDDGNKFDPIGQHRPFCPWIASREKNLPGWKLTLQTLVKDESSPIVGLPLSSDEVNDPIISIRRLFSSPVLKRSS